MNHSREPIYLSTQKYKSDPLTCQPSPYPRVSAALSSPRLHRATTVTLRRLILAIAGARSRATISTYTGHCTDSEKWLGDSEDRRFWFTTGSLLLLFRPLPSRRISVRERDAEKETRVKRVRRLRKKDFSRREGEGWRGREDVGTLETGCPEYLRLRELERDRSSRGRVSRSGS